MKGRKKATQAPTARPKPVKMTKLAGGGERPETSADRWVSKKLAKAEARKPDAGRAFHIASDMEDDLTSLDHLINALHLIAEGMHEPRESGALYAIANGLQVHHEELEKKASQIFHLTWGYRFGDQEKREGEKPQ